MRGAATRLRIISLAGRGLFEEAQRLVPAVARGEVPDGLGVLHGISRLYSTANSVTKPQIARLELQIAKALGERRASMPAAEQERFDYYRAQGYVMLGQPSQAVELYEAQLAKSPPDKRCLVSAARALGSFDAKSCIEKSKSLWQHAESLERPGSGDWLFARYNVVRCCLRLKQTEECAALLRATRLLYPEMGGAELKARFDKIEEQLKRPNL
jgi:hypothetical protein